MSSPVFVRYSPYTSEHSLTSQLVQCYREVFADVPWNEWLQCPVCKAYWGIKDKEFLHSCQFRHCGVALVEYWPKDRVNSDLMREIRRDSSAWLTLDENRVIGFCWGYPIDKSTLEAELKIILPGDKVGYNGLDHLAYQDEVGVVSSHRGQKLAKKMVALRHDDFLAKGLKVGVVRTRQLPVPSDTFGWYTTKLGYEIIARYPGDDGRVVLARPLEGLRELLSI